MSFWEKIVENLKEKAQEILEDQEENSEESETETGDSEDECTYGAPLEEMSLAALALTICALCGRGFKYESDGWGYDLIVSPKKMKSVRSSFYFEYRGFGVTIQNAPNVEKSSVKAAVVAALDTSHAEKVRERAEKAARKEAKRAEKRAAKEEKKAKRAAKKKKKVA